MSRTFLAIQVLCCITCLLTSGCTRIDYEKVAPNVIIILLDDLGYQDVGFNGCLDIPTPHIDRIAEEGVRFTNAYVSYPVCGPSRAGLMTGRYQDRFGFGRNPLFAPNDPTMGLPLQEQTLAEALNDADYTSIAIGKWHLGAHPSLRPLRRGFDAFFGFLGGGHSYFPNQWNCADEYAISSQFESYHTKLLRDNERIEESAYLTDALSREAVKYVEQYQDSLFFMYLAYNAPHTPLQASEKHLRRFAHIEDPKRKTYAAMIAAVDDGIGLLLDKLEALQLDDNTLIFFLSDNGGPERKNASDNGILRGGKSDLFEGGIRVPFAMRWPEKIPPAQTYDGPIISLDIFATIAAQAQLVPRHTLDGVDLLPYLMMQTDKRPHAYLFWRKFDQKYYAVRDAVGNKLLSHSNADRFLHLPSNIEERSDLALPPSITTQNLKKAYQHWATTQLDPVFMGLRSNQLYDAQHPDRFHQPN